MRRWCLLMLGAVVAVSACGDDTELEGHLGGTVTLDASDASPEAGDAVSEASDAIPDAPEGQPDGPPDIGTGERASETGSDGAGDVSTSAGTPGTKVMVAISAAEGGVVQLGDASLLVLADTLASDQVIDLAVNEPAANLANLADVAGNVHVFGPAPTSFVTPAVLRLPLVGSIPSGKDAVIAWWNPVTNQWVPVPSHIEPGHVIGLVSQLGTFAVLAVDKTDVCPFSGSCDGAPEGSWELSSACVRPLPPFHQACGAGLAVAIRQNVSVTGTLTLANGRYTVNQTLTLVASVFFTPACLDAINQSQQAASCSAVEASLRKQPGGMWICRGKLAQGCSCAITSMLPRNEAGAVVGEGRKLTFTKDGEDMPSATAQFCTREHVMTFKDSGGAVYSMVKQH